VESNYREVYTGFKESKCGMSLFEFSPERGIMSAWRDREREREREIFPWMYQTIQNQYWQTR
jgi:hypothetical protein